MLSLFGAALCNRHLQSQLAITTFAISTCNHHRQSPTSTSNVQRLRHVLLCPLRGCAPLQPHHLRRTHCFDYVSLNAEEETFTDWVQVGNADGLASFCPSQWRSECVGRFENIHIGPKLFLRAIMVTKVKRFTTHDICTACAVQSNQGTLEGSTANAQSCHRLCVVECHLQFHHFLRTHGCILGP